MDLLPDLRLLLRAADVAETTLIIGTYASGKTRLAAAIAAMNGAATYNGELAGDRFKQAMVDAKMVLPAEFTVEKKPDALVIYDWPGKPPEDVPPNDRLVVCVQARKGAVGSPIHKDAFQNPLPSIRPTLVIGLHVTSDKRRIATVHKTTIPILEGKEIDITDLIQTMNDWRKAAEGSGGNRATG
jgi:hypothetical protein